MLLNSLQEFENLTGELRGAGQAIPGTRRALEFVRCGL